VSFRSISSSLAIESAMACISGSKCSIRSSLRGRPQPSAMALSIALVTFVDFVLANEDLLPENRTILFSYFYTNVSSPCPQYLALTRDLPIY